MLQKITLRKPYPINQMLNSTFKFGKGKSMKTILFFLIIFCTVVPSAFGELTIQDLDKIRLIVKEEVADEIAPIKVEISSMNSEISSMNSEISSIKSEISLMKTEIGSVKENMASLNGRVGGIEKQITWLMAIIIVAVGIPQVIVAWRSRKDREQDKRIEELAREIESLKRQQIVNP